MVDAVHELYTHESLLLNLENELVSCSILSLADKTELSSIIHGRCLTIRTSSSKKNDSATTTLTQHPDPTLRPTTTTKVVNSTVTIQSNIL